MQFLRTKPLGVAAGLPLAFALVRTPVAAAACYVFAWAAYGLHRSGFSANLVRH